jgi:adenylate cyclase
MSIKRYIKELKRRNVFKAAIAYLIVSWLIIQVTSIVLPVFEAPTYLLKTLLFILGIGFFIWVVFSWIYDVTEDGIKKTKNISIKEPNYIKTSGRLTKIIIISLSFVVVLLLVNQFRSSKENILPKTNILSGNILASKKMAVLPFLNTKPDENSDYLGFALADQIIGGLIYVNAINIRPSSSIRKYEKTTINPIIVGKELDVEYLLVGNYLMEGGAIRLNIELINTTTNSIILREPLQLNFKSAFELQDIVSEKIIDKLKLHFAPGEQNRIRKNIPSNILAYEYYLKAISYPNTTKSSAIAVKMLGKSIELDSTYAPAYSSLADRLHNLANYGLKGSKELDKAEKYYLKALSLNDEFINAYYGLSTIYTESGRAKKSIKTIKKLLEINPNDSQSHQFLGYIYRYVGLINESIEEMKKAKLLDNNVRTTIGTSYISIGKYEEAFNSFETPKKTSLDYGFQGIIRYRQGRTSEALSLLKKVSEVNPNSLNELWASVLIAIINGNKEKGLVAARKFEEYNISDSEAWFQFGINYALLGDNEGALRCLSRAVNGGYFNYPQLLNDPLLNPLRTDTNFKLLLKKTKKLHLDFKKDI